MSLPRLLYYYLQPLRVLLHDFPYEFLGYASLVGESPHQVVPAYRAAVVLGPVANTDLEGNFGRPAGVEEAEEVDAVPLGGDRFCEGYGG